MASTVTAPPRTGRFLPPDPRVEEPYRLTPQLALRIAILGAVVLAAFAVLFLRVWSLQVLSGPAYLHAAQNNQLRTVRIQAPRGAILDRDGDVLVGNTAGHSVQIWPADLPREGRYRLLKRLARIVNAPAPWIARQVEKNADDPLTPVTVKRGIHPDQVAYLYEHQREFPGVRVAQTYLRDYPFKATAAHVLGYVGEASQEQLDRNRKLRSGDEVGKGGIEAAYDAVLRGRAGVARLRVDSLGRPRSGLEPRDLPRQGLALRLTSDAQLQRATERALKYGIFERARRDDCFGCWSSNGGAIVALDPRNGEVLAMASYPTYKPSLFVGRVDQRKIDRLREKRANAPLVNRATSGLYPPGSTFKPVTALAAMEEHLVAPYDTLACTPQYERYDQVFRNWNPYVSAQMTLPTALEQSCDTYFYELGYQFYKLPPEYGHPLQDWAARMGFGQRTGLDLGHEEPGLLPTPEWREKTFKTELDRAWKPGDSIQLAIGQKDLLVTPLQMARFYALVANGGRLVTPHLALAAEEPGQGGGGPVVRQVFTPPAPKPSGIDPGALEVVEQGLYLATHGANGTATGIFGSFPIPVVGKTGTAEKVVDGALRDQSWWCGYGPRDNARIVVCAVIENGGHGGTAAAPAARRVFEAFFGVRGGPISSVYSD